MRGMNSTEFVQTIQWNQWTEFPHKHQLETIQWKQKFIQLQKSPLCLWTTLLQFTACLCSLTDDTALCKCTLPLFFSADLFSLLRFLPNYSFRCSFFANSFAINDNISNSNVVVWNDIYAWIIVACLNRNPMYVLSWHLLFFMHFSDQHQKIFNHMIELPTIPVGFFGEVGIVSCIVFN